MRRQTNSWLEKTKRRISNAVENTGSLSLFIVGLTLVLLGSNHEVLAQSAPYDGLVQSFKPLDYGVCAIFRFAEGSYGALLTTVAGIIAIASAAFGKYNQAYNMLIVSVGCFILRSFISLFFAHYSCLNNDPTSLWHIYPPSSETTTNTGDGGGNTPGVNDFQRGGSDGLIFPDEDNEDPKEEAPAPIEGETPDPEGSVPPLPIGGGTPDPDSSVPPLPIEGETPDPDTSAVPAPIEGETPDPGVPVKGSRL